MTKKATKKLSLTVTKGKASRKSSTPVSRVPTDKYSLKISAGSLVKADMKEYGEEVIEDRAVPDFRDGLKPVQRRILYAMKNDLNLSHLGATRKCAAVVGSTMGTYHPHGDSSIYSALVNLYHQRYRLVMPRGNFGSELERESAMRYTEAKFTRYHQDIFHDMDVMERMPNFDGTTTEPLVINTRLPLMLMNGASGIAVGLSVDIPSHNLKELVEALVYVAKHPKTAKTEDVCGIIQGPDFRNGGMLLSKKQDILEMYKTGYGSLEFQCEYKLGKDDDGRTTIEVIGYPDEVFSVSGFINACEKFREAGNVYAVEADYIDSRFGDKSIDNKPLRTHSVKITVSNRKGLDDVMKKLIVRKTYQFYTTKRTEDGIDLKTYNLVQILKQWIRWRKSEEQKMLELELKRTERKLWCETTRLIAMQPKHIDIIAEALKQNKVAFEDYLVKHLKVTREQAEFIADLKVGNLRKANIPEQEKKIAEIKKEILRIKDDLAHITRVVIKHLKALSVYFDERRTKLNGKAHNTAKIKVERTGDPVVMMSAKDGKLFTKVTERGTTTQDVIAVASFEGSTVIDESGLTCVMSTTECEGKAGPAYKNIVGMTGNEAQWLIGVTKNGYAVKTSGPEQQKQSEFTLVKGGHLIGGFGANSDSVLLLWGKKPDEFAHVRVDKIKEMRKNTAGAKIASFKVVRALVVHADQTLYTDDASRVSLTKAGDVDHKTKLMVLGTKNLVIWKSGRRKFMDKNTTVKELARDKSGVRFIYPVTVPGVEAVKE